METFDVTVPLRPEMPVYEGDPPVVLERMASLAAGDVANVTRVSCSAHAGTHVDAPVHFFDGAAGAETLPLETLIGLATVVDATWVEGDIDAEALSRMELGDAERVLFKTTNSELWNSDRFTHDFVAIAPDAAAELAGRARLVGVDYLSVGSPETHRTLLEAGVVVVEGLDFRAVEPGPYHLACLPLKLVGSDGAPARAVLLRENPYLE